MSKIILKKEADKDNRFDLGTITFEFNSDDLDSMMQQYRYFLLALGYSPEQVNEVIEPE